MNKENATEIMGARGGRGGRGGGAPANTLRYGRDVQMQALGLRCS
jgi:hypothetical protein